MPDTAMTMDTRKHLPMGVFGEHLMHRFGMAGNAGALSHSPIPRFDLNGLVKILQREGQRMIESVVGLRQ